MKLTDILKQFFPDPDETIWFRTFDAKKIPNHLKGGARNIPTSITQLQTDLETQQSLKEINKRQGIYFAVNSGGTHDKDIDRINAIFCEIDDRPIIEQHDILDNQSPWSPSIRIETKKSVHAYWLLSEPITTENFLELQQGLIKFYNSDKSIKNLSRVMRVPFFNHVSYDDGYVYQRITCHTFRPDLRYTLAELREGFPHTPTPEHLSQWEKPSGSLETLEDVKAELRARIMMLPSWSTSGRWGCANGVCHSGEGDTGLRVDLASGTVTCWSECSLKQILNAFGLELPRDRRFEYLPKRQQTSALYRWYQEQKAK